MNPGCVPATNRTMDTIYYLSSCDTCRRILKELRPPSGIRLQDIKVEPVSESQLGEMWELSGSYEALVNKRARLFAARDLKNRQLGESDYRALLLEHYTFLKRPVIVTGGAIFMGNAAKTVAAAAEALHP